MYVVATHFSPHPTEVYSLVPGIPCITDCVMAELEKLGHRYRVALRWDKLESTVLHALTLSQNSTRPALRAPYMHTRGHIRRRLSRPARYGAQVLHRRNLRSRAAPPDTSDSGRAPHVCRAEAIRNRASPGPGGTGLTMDIARGCNLSCLSSSLCSPLIPAVSRPRMYTYM